MESERKEYEKWIIKAESDLKLIDKDINSDEPLTDIICFHAQQAAEKYLKAFLIFKQQIPEKIHIIERLIEICMKIDRSFEELKPATLLTEYAVELRYPDDFYVPDIEEAENARDLALLVKDFVTKKISSEI